MKCKAIVSTVMAVSMSMSAAGFAFAQDHGRNARAQHGRAHVEQRRDERGAGPNHNFHRGERLPAEYRHRNYVVEDWRGHHLSAPPRGYHWVQTGGDYVLVAIATGIIAQLLLGN